MTNDRAWDAGIEVARLTGAGLPLAAGLRAYAGEAGSRRVRRAVEEVCKNLEAGMAVDEALRSQASLFPAHIRALIVAATETGQLEDTLSRLLSVRAMSQSLRRTAWQGLVYPLVLILLSAAVVIFIQATVGVTTAEMVAEFETETSVHTQMYLALYRNGPWPVLLALGLTVAALVAFRWIIGKARWRWLFDRVPFVGPLWRFAALSEWTRLVGLLIERRISLPRSLAFAADATDDADLARGCRQLAADVTAGYSFSEALGRQQRFPESLIPLVVWGERHATLTEALDTAAEIFGGRAQGQLTLVRLAVPPIVFMVVAFAVVSAMIACLSPLFVTITALS